MLLKERPPIAQPAPEGSLKRAFEQDQLTASAKSQTTGQKAVDQTPSNGLAGLKHWRQDMLAALVVALVSVPLSLGIALASGAPPLCGLTSEIIAGLIFPFLGGAYVAVSGPAAGLAPVLFAGITTLGRGNMEVGYHLMLCVILMVGFVQLILTWMKAAKFSQMFPQAAIHGMLAAIGFLLAAKQIPNFIGSPFHAHEFFAVMAEMPSELLNHLQPNVFSIGVICLILLFQLSGRQVRGGFLRYIPPQLTVVLVGVALAQLYHLDAKYLVKVPDNVLAHGFAFPDFGLLMSSLSLLPQVIVFVLILSFVDGTESLATIQAVDRIDPFHRKSSPDRTLFAMGISNICSSLIGGLTIIPGIIKSSTGIVSGARTAWVNFYNAIFLIIFLLVANDLIRMIPVASLAAVLMHIGYKLAGPHKWRSMAQVGVSQLSIFAVTIVVTLMSDLLVGIFTGMLLKLLLLIWYNSHSNTTPSKCIASIFASPLESTALKDGRMHIYFKGTLNCFNSLKVRSVMDGVPANIKEVVLHFTDEVSVVDHSNIVYFNTVKDDWKRVGRELEFVGLDNLQPCTKDPTSLRYRRRSPITSTLIKNATAS